MATVTMPQLGESVTEGTVLHWLKQPGDAVALDDSLCEIETEKVTAELPSPFAGTMGPQLVPEGEVALVGQPLCEIAEAGARAGSSRVPVSAGTRPDATVPVAAAEPPAASLTSPTDTVAATSRNPEPRARFYSPAVVRLAREHGVALDDVAGTGIGGRVRRKDVEQAIERASRAPVVAASSTEHLHDTGPAYRVAELTPTRRTIATNMQRSMRDAPQAWTMIEADVTALVALRDSDRGAFEERHGVRLTLLPYFVRAACQALRRFPILNARWSGDELRIFADLDIGIAVGTEAGLVVPVVHQADRLSVEGLAVAINELAEKARNRRLRIEDIEGGTFTVNNTGAFGSIASKPIVNNPQVGIVTMERAVRRPIAIDDQTVGIRWMMNVCLSFDHRAMDGTDAGGFLAALRELLEAPGR